MAETFLEYSLKEYSLKALKKPNPAGIL